MAVIIINFFKILFIYFYREGREGEERARNINVQGKHQSIASRMPPTGDLDHNPGTCPDWESNQQPFRLQASTQSTVPHQPGLIFIIVVIVTVIFKNLTKY